MSQRAKPPINTLLQRGVGERRGAQLLQRFLQSGQTVETVSQLLAFNLTQLKQGVNERKPFATRAVFRLKFCPDHLDRL